MIKAHQLFRHEPHNDIIGDCYRTAIGCLLGLPPQKVPHFVADRWYGKHDDVEAAVADWLGERGYMLASVWYTEYPLEMMAGANPNLVYLLSGKSPRGNWPHVVVAKGGNIIWDPSPKDRPGWGELHGPCPGNDLWQVEILTPILWGQP